jgi:NADH:ubiquinone oxidoreductase subunit F (NADH-binding)/NAD-dependent dihydropyrimidine dehydrogenase PreA subunit
MTTTRRCCDKCWHDADRPCADLVRCLTEGPLCHEDENCRAEIHERVRSAGCDTQARPVLYAGTGTCGLGAGAARMIAAARTYLEERGITAEIVEVGCIGLCSSEPILDVQLPGRARLSFEHVTHEKVSPLLDSLFTGMAPAETPLAQHRSDVLIPWPGVPFLDEHPFFAPQTRWVLAGCGVVDPTSIDAAIARGAYRALADTIRFRTPGEVCDLVEKSGLRGRGGGGFPTGRKWKFALKTPSDQRYLICNADEGDPGAFMDRAVIEGDPHRLIEGIAIAAYAIGATKAVVYIRAEYPLAIARLRRAIDQAKDVGLLGKNILDSGFRLDVGIKMGAGAFVCGEETALIHSVEGKRGMPRPRPPFPAVQGLFEKPTVINNVETLANLPGILANGPEWFASVGTETSKGTKVFALSGKVACTGLIEVAMGTPMRRIIFDIGGGIPGGHSYKAAQIGGPSGGCIPEEHLDIQIDYESLKTVGAMMGSGGLVVMDDATCMVDVAKFFMDFIQRESCGKCIPCREGTRRMLEILESISRARRNETGLGALERFQGIMHLRSLAKVIQETSLCGLGQSAPNPVLSTLRWFPEEYESHIYDRHCPAHVCTELLLYSIDPELCKGCTLCAKKCPADAILGAPKSPHYIVPEKCIGCGSCMDACRLHAVLAN